MLRIGCLEELVARPTKKTDNEIVAEWLIEHRWKESLNSDTKQKMPAFVEDAVMASVYIVAGTSNGQVNISPKLVFKCLMLKEITTESVATREVGYNMSKRQAQRLAQTVRFALEGIKHVIQEYELNTTIEDLENIEMEREFIKDYYFNRESKLYSTKSNSLPIEIFNLYLEKKYLEYAEAVRYFRLNH